MPEACDLLIDGGFVLTLDGADRVLADGAVAITADRIVAAIMPPTKSRYRHGATFYEEEKKRFVASLRHDSTVIVIGWRAGGTDTYYVDALSEVRKAEVKLSVYVIDYEGDGRTLTTRLCQLFGPGASVVCVDTSGFSIEAVTRMEAVLV